MTAITFQGPPDSAVMALRAAISGGKYGRPISQAWTGESLIVIFEGDASGARRVAGALLAIVAAAIFAYAGFQMVELRTVGGNTVAELFDNAVGILSFGLAALSMAYAAR
ncbi:MAG: hypothetical protein QOH61_792 [Chloroflexota bacterium]|jgi:hypothetical protein|nr:hypothetical protein [Chloroflexota bacterium]